MDIDSFVAALKALDPLKAIERRSYVLGGERRENSAEHSWHVAIAAWLVTHAVSAQVSLERVLKLALVHDICEIDAGDTPLYDADQSGKSEREAACMARISAIAPDVLGELSDLWREYEEQSSLESRVFRVADRFMPLLHNLWSEGKTWREQGITRSQVMEVHEGTRSLWPDLYAWIERLVDDAVERGWLRDG